MKVGQKINSNRKQDDPRSSSVPRYVTVITQSSSAREPRPPLLHAAGRGEKGGPETTPERARILASRLTVLLMTCVVISAPTNERRIVLF